MDSNLDQNRQLSYTDMNAPRVLLEAHEYARLGLRVTTLWPGSKKPILHNWQQRASTKPAVYTNLFKNPDVNIGIVTGRGIFALDVDPRNGGTKSLDQLQNRFPFPRTAEAITGSRGRHFLFRVPQGVKIKNKTGLRPGIDIKGDGGMIVVEPSVQETGREYAWLIHPSQGIADTPPELERLLKRERLWDENVGREQGIATLPLRPVGGKTADQETLLREMIERYPITEQGTRNDLMVRGARVSARAKF